MNQETSPARLYAGLVGGVLVIAGIIGFFYSASFGSPGTVDDVFGILSVNAWHNIVHLATGALGVLAYAAGARSSRTYAWGLGVVYIAVAIWGFIIGSGDSILGFIPINTEDNWLHVILGVVGLLAAAASGEERTTAAPASA
jgi:Domain of unknown function (DUF4383)